MPRSLWFFAFTAVVYYLQYIPGIDVMLMILLASMWPIVTVNMGFAGIAIEAISGAVSRGWLCVPLAYFGGNLILAGASHYQFWQLERSIEAANATQSLPFPSEGTLVIDATRSAMGGIAEGLIGRFDIPLVYQISDSSQGVFAWRMATGALCRARDPGKGTAFGYQEKRRLVAGMCTYRSKQTPPREAVKLIFSPPTTHESFLLPYEKHVLTITDGKHEPIELLYARARPLTWFPMPFGGCFRGPGDPKSACTFGPLRVFATPIGDTAAMVATALKLTPSPASERRQKIEARASQAALRPALSF